MLTQQSFFGSPQIHIQCHKIANLSLQNQTMDNFLHKPCVASAFAQDEFTKSNHFGYTNNDDNDDDSFVLTSCQCEKRANENKIVDSTFAFFATTQHTLSTFCSTEGDDDDDLSGCWNDDEISLGSFNDGYLIDGFFRLDGTVDSVEPKPIAMITNNTSTITQPMVITFNNCTINGSIQDNSNENIYHGDDLTASFHNSQESLFLGASRGCFQQQSDMMIVGPQGDCSTKQGFNDSMSSLSEAFEKLDYCMIRTAQSRKLVRQYTEKLTFSSQATLSCTAATTTASAATATLSTRTACSILRSNSSSSLTCGSSVSSRSHRKGSKRVHKTRRQGTKATLSNKTGVAIRTLLNASFS